jgi:hypothetical protein
MLLGGAVISSNKAAVKRVPVDGGCYRDHIPRSEL